MCIELFESHTWHSSILLASYTILDWFANYHNMNNIVYCFFIFITMKILFIWQNKNEIKIPLVHGVRVSSIGDRDNEDVKLSFIREENYYNNMPFLLVLGHFRWHWSVQSMNYDIEINAICSASVRFWPNSTWSSIKYQKKKKNRSSMEFHGTRGYGNIPWNSMELWIWTKFHGIP